MSEDTERTRVEKLPPQEEIEEKSQQGSVDELVDHFDRMGNGIKDEGNREVARAKKKSEAPENLSEFREELDLLHEQVDLTLEDLRREIEEIEGGGDREKILSQEIIDLPSNLSALERTLEIGKFDDAEITNRIYKNLHDTLMRRTEGKDLGGREGMSKREGEDLQDEKHSIQEALSYLCRGEANSIEKLGGLTALLGQRKNEAEIELDPTDAQKSGALDKDLEVYSKWLDNETEEEAKRLRIGMTKDQKATIEEKKEEAEKLKNRKSAQGEEKERLDKKISNLEEMLKVISETQKNIKILNRIFSEILESRDTEEVLNEVFADNEEEKRQFIEKIELDKPQIIREQIAMLGWEGIIDKIDETKEDEDSKTERDRARDRIMKSIQKRMEEEAA